MCCICTRACICGLALYDLVYFVCLIILWPFTLIVSLVGCIVWVVLWPFASCCSDQRKKVKKKMIKMPKKWGKKIKKRGKKSRKSSRKSVSLSPV
jgi:hypothetical protein